MQNDSTKPLNDSPLRAAREARGMSLRATARQSRLDPAHLSRVERGQKQVSIEGLYRLATVLELDELVSTLRPYIRNEAAA
ncbi:helix-turn-helix domain-containing protein [Streptomyces sp. NPDC056534]|uniref:helix-turn-helix domain-containing protein n=1 Tax=Streptomyces sp. NPDC056534 TaxID=3345857 RepID=UPI0036B922D3